MPRKLSKIKVIKKSVKKEESEKQRKVKPVKPQKFREIMDRLDLIDKEIGKEKELFDIKIKSLKLEKEYLWSIVKPKNR